VNEAQRAGMMSSATPEWATPAEVFAPLNAEFGFTIDVCAVPENAKCDRFFTPEQNGLAQKWTGVCWMNPPYGRGIGAWIRKAWESAQAGATVVCLIPSRTDTAWWHDYVMRGEIRFQRGRIYFEPTYGNGAGDRAPFPSAVVIFKPAPTHVGAQGDWNQEGAR
jgi:phage N-6-adenine-methyltransferase